MGDLLSYVPVAATAFAIPQFLPQIIKVRMSGDTTGVSWTWAALTSINNAAWFGYFVLSRFWSALAPATAAVLLAGALAMMPACRKNATRKAVVLTAVWCAGLIAVFIVSGRAGLGTALTAAFVIQVAPRSGPPTGPRIPPESRAEPGCSSSAS